MPTSSQVYYDYSLGVGEGLALVVDVVGVSTSAPVTIVVTASSDTGLPGGAAALSGVYGAVTHALWAKLNLDLDRTTPGANTVMPAYTSVLASTGEALTYLAGADHAAWGAAVAAVPGLLANGAKELAGDASVRTPYSLALLASAV